MPMNIGEAMVTEIAEQYHIPTNDIEDVYPCTPLQVSMIASNRAEMFHFVMSFGPGADIDRFSDALVRVVSANATLRTRIVQSTQGTRQVVTKSKHVIEQRSGPLEQYLKDADCLGLGAPLFRTAFIERVFIATIHHAVMDHWSWATLLNVDLATAYYGERMILRPPFRNFVEHCQAIDEPAARAFWASRFTGAPGIFPACVPPNHTPNVTQKPERNIHIGHIGNGLAPAHVPYYIEAAWALTAAAYTGTDEVAYGYVLSGRSSALNGLEDTLGPAIVEVPIQATLQPGMTVERLIKDRSTSMRQLQAQPALQDPPDKIPAISDAARHASGFRVLINVRPSVPPAPDGSDVTLDRVVWLRGSFPLQLVFTLLDDGVTIEPRSDSGVISDAQLSRILDQFEYMLLLLVEAAPQTKLADLPRLNPRDRKSISHLNASRNSVDRPSNLVGAMETNRDVAWIVSLKNSNQLAPWGSIGEIWIEAKAQDDVNGVSKPPSNFPSSPPWASSFSSTTGSAFSRTGNLGRYSDDGNICVIGKCINRVNFKGQVVQLEELEELLKGCAGVAEVVTLVKVSRGRLHIACVFSVATTAHTNGTVKGTANGTANHTVSAKANGITNGTSNGTHDGANGTPTGPSHDSFPAFAKARLPSDLVPTIWAIMDKIPRTSDDFDRAAVREWLKGR